MYICSIHIYASIQMGSRMDSCYFKHHPTISNYYLLVGEDPPQVVMVLVGLFAQRRSSTTTSQRYLNLRLSVLDNKHAFGDCQWSAQPE